MREIDVSLIRRTVADLCIEANCQLSPDIRAALAAAWEREEPQSLAAELLQSLLANAAIASERRLPLCQDTGLAVVFVELGQDVHLIGGEVEEAINAGVAEGYGRGYLRASVLRDPLRRENTGDNTPAIIHYRLKPGDGLKIIVAPKGFGSENMSAVALLKPSEGAESVKDFIVQTVRRAGPNPCPPVIVGVGVGGSLEKAALMAKEALLRPVGQANEDPFWAELEAQTLARINELDIGPAGFGGLTSALAVHIMAFATHIAGLPVAVNMGCHVTRHAERSL